MYCLRLTHSLLVLLLLLTGASTSRAADALIPGGTEWRYFKGTSEPMASDPSAWRLPNFDDAAWFSGHSPVFYGRALEGTELGDMQGRYTSVYLRKTFQVADVAHLDELVLSLLSDDGAVAWINGHEVMRKNVPDGELLAGATALTPVSEPLAFEEFRVPRPWEFLVEGANVLCVQALNVTKESRDFALEAHLTATWDTAPPMVSEVVPPAGATVDELLVAEVFFDEPVQGVSAEDLLINGIPASELRVVAPDHYVFSFPQPAAGRVDFRWSSTHGITDILGQSHPFAGGEWALTLDPAASRKNLTISEFMADNDRSVFDDDCDNPDWIEIYNSGTTPIDLQGWALTDDAAHLGKWRFPHYVLDGGAYLVVFASQKNKTTLATRILGTCRGRTNAFIGFHTNFKLDPDGEYLGLVAPDGEVISEFAPAYPPQRRDVSYGRVPGSPEKTAYFGQPTPGAQNASSGEGFTPPVRYSQAGGTFIRPFLLTLSTDQPGAAIHYTLDGTFPTEGNPSVLLYTKPIEITNTVQVRSQASAPDLLPSAPKSETYLALSPSPDQLNSFTSSLPIVVITTLKSATIGSSKNTSVHFSVFEPNDGLTTLLSRPTLSTRGGIKTRGSSTGGQPQSNFAIEWWDEFDQDQDLPILGMPEDSEWVLYAPNEFDPPLIHNPFTMELSRQMESPTQKTRFVEVYLNKGGPIRSTNWFGLYVLMTKPGLAKGRIDAPKAQPEDVEPPEVTGSYMLKSDRLDPGDSGISAGGQICGFVEPKEREMKSPQRASQMAYLRKYFNDTDLAFRPTNPNYRDPVLGYRGYIEVTNWVDFHLLETLSGQVDAIRLSTYFYKRRNGKIEFGPRWDYDRAWESKGDSRDDNPRVWDTGGGLFGPPWFQNVFRDQESWQLWCDRWAHFRKGPLSRSNMFAVIDRLTNEVRYIQPREAKKWGATLPRGSYPAEIAIMKNWISNRLDWIDSQFASAPILSSGDAVVTPGFKLTLTLPKSISSPANAQIFYTVDGSDPRPPLGTNTPTSFTYTGPIAIDRNARVVARVRDLGRIQRSTPSSTPWSAPVAATFVVTPPPLVLTELMYHPADAPSGSPWTRSDFEYLELKNISGQPVRLAGYHFTAGIQFQFPASGAITELAAGERVLVVHNLQAFLSRYPGVHNIAGEFTGDLNNDGEHLVLLGPLEEPIFDLTYSPLWQPITDGPGFSLVLADETTPPSELNQSLHWRASAAEGGSPGQADGLVQTSPRVLINEVLAFPQQGQDDAIELYNPNPTRVDLSGWWLSDDFQTPKKVRLQTGTSIGAGAYLVIPAAILEAGDGGFGLSASGDGAWLFAADRDGNLTGVFHGFEFGASEPGVSFGRQTVGNGTAASEVLWPQFRPTLGAANVGAYVGPVVFSELVPAPSALGAANRVQDSYVEIRNRTEQSQPLHDPAEPTQTWHVRGDVDFDFPPGFTLPAHGHVVLVAFDPTQDTYDAAIFRAAYGLPDRTLMLGPWRGTLTPETHQARLRLLKPGVPNPPVGNRGPSILVDEVHSAVDSGWDERGFAMGNAFVRKDLSAIGNDPANWVVSSPTPGDDDADQDGLGDAWELAHGLNPHSGSGADGADGDPDGDGFNNSQEAHNQTEPRDPSSSVRIQAYLSSANLLNFVLAAPAGQLFRLESRSNLDGAPWDRAQELNAPPSGLVQFTTTVGNESAMYFRVVKP